MAVTGLRANLAWTGLGTNLAWTGRGTNLVAKISEDGFDPRDPDREVADVQPTVHLLGDLRFRIWGQGVIMLQGFTRGPVLEPFWFLEWSFTIVNNLYRVTSIAGPRVNRLRSCRVNPFSMRGSMGFRVQGFGFRTWV